MIKVVAFDLDNTLWESEIVIRRAELRLMEWFEDNVPQSRYDTIDMRELRQEVLKKHPELSGKVTGLRRFIISEILKASAVEPCSIDKTTDAAMKVFLEARNEVEVFPGAIDVIKLLAKKYVIGAITNGNADINSTTLANYFSFSFTAETIGAPKPCTKIFRHALNFTNCLPQEMIYVGDDPILDIDAANELGIHTVWLANSKSTKSGNTKASAKINNIRELTGAVSEIIQSLDQQ